MRKLSSVMGNSQRLDGGAMFGNVPRALWSKWVQIDEKNRIPLATRALLIEEDGRNILLETGIGNFFEPKLRERFGVFESGHVLLDSLQTLGLSHEDIDIVVLSHLHFDHAGGLLKSWQEGKEPELLFPKATYLVGVAAWQRARYPHARDRASFIPGLVKLLQQSDRLDIVEGAHSKTLGVNYRFHVSDGHTPGMLLTEINMDDGPVVYMADLAPGTAWLHLPVSMGYDRYAEHLIDEKTALLANLLERDGRLFYTHDPDFCLSRLQRDDSGRYSALDPVARITRLTH